MREMKSIGLAGLMLFAATIGLSNNNDALATTIEFVGLVDNAGATGTTRFGTDGYDLYSTSPVGSFMEDHGYTPFAAGSRIQSLPNYISSIAASALNGANESAASYAYSSIINPSTGLLVQAGCTFNNAKSNLAEANLLDITVGSNVPPVFYIGYMTDFNADGDYADLVRAHTIGGADSALITTTGDKTLGIDFYFFRVVGARAGDIITLSGVEAQPNGVSGEYHLTVSGLTFTQVNPVPEPSTFALLGAGAIGLLACVWRWRALRKGVLRCCVAIMVSSLSYEVARADVLNMGPGLTSLEMVPVGDPSNAADDTGYGSVGYNYQMGKYEVTNAQYCQFLNAKAATDTYGLYNTSMGSQVYGGINRKGSSGSYTYSLKSGYENKPVVYVSWYNSLRFVNWLQNGQGTGSTETGTYTITGGGVNSGTVTIPDAATRATWTPATKHWVLPSENEWYKAAYYQPATEGGDTDNYWAFATATNSTPYSDNPLALNYPTNSANYRNDDGNSSNGVNDGYAVASPRLTDVGAYNQSLSYYGTMDQAGNVAEWNEAIIGSSRGVRSGAWTNYSNGLAASYRYNYDPSYEYINVGFRVARVPEPGSIALLLAGTVAGLIWWRRRGA